MTMPHTYEINLFLSLFFSFFFNFAINLAAQYRNKLPDLCVVLYSSLFQGIFANNSRHCRIAVSFPLMKIKQPRVPLSGSVQYTINKKLLCRAAKTICSSKNGAKCNCNARKRQNVKRRNVLSRDLTRRFRDAYSRLWNSWMTIECARSWLSLVIWQGCLMFLRNTARPRTRGADQSAM